jgi:hypothetical protein
MAQAKALDIHLILAPKGNTATYIYINHFVAGGTAL